MKRIKRDYVGLARQSGIPRDVIYQRINDCHWSVEKAVAMPYKKKPRNGNNQFSKQALAPYGVICYVPFSPITGGLTGRSVMYGCWT